MGRSRFKFLCEENLAWGINLEGSLLFEICPSFPRRGERWIVEWINRPIIKRQSYIVVDSETSIDIREGGSASGKKIC